jgi:hypothetical protein
MKETCCVVKRQKCDEFHWKTRKWVNFKWQRACSVSYDQVWSFHERKRRCWSVNTDECNWFWDMKGLLKSKLFSWNPTFTTFILSIIHWFLTGLIVAIIFSVVSSVFRLYRKNYFNEVSEKHGKICFISIMVFLLSSLSQLSKAIHQMWQLSWDLTAYCINFRLNDSWCLLLVCSEYFSVIWSLVDYFWIEVL